jgi:KUP system potassium uptake protein
VPFVNWTMMVLTIALTIGFGSSERLSGAYGTAVSTTMLLTTALLYNAMRDNWHWPTPAALLASGVFLVVDLVFFAANLLKIADGGWIPLTLAAVLLTLMTTWHAGVEAYQRKQAAMAETLAQFRARLRRRKIARVPGTAIFLTRLTDKVPMQLIAYTRQFHTLPQTVIALTISFADVPRIERKDRLELDEVFDGVWEMTARYGFVEVPDLPAALRGAKTRGCPVDFAEAVFFGTRDQIIRDRNERHLWRWQIPIFAFLFRNAVRAVDLFNLPPQNFVEISRQVEL